jgi:hypothetical protein
MTDPKLTLLCEMAEHMEYMQTCLKEDHHLDEWDDYHWFRRSEELLAEFEKLSVNTLLTSWRANETSN